MGEAFVITSGKGGVGKSTLSAQLGVGLTRAGKKVVLLDADMGLRSLDVLLGLEDQIVYDVTDVAEGVCRLKQALTRDAAHEGLFLLAASQTRDSGAVTAAEMFDIVSRLKERFDFVIIDCPAGIGRGFRNAAAGADRAVIVSTPDAVALRSAEHVVGRLARSDLLHPVLVLNRVSADQMKGDIAGVMERFCQRLEAEPLGIIPEDPSIVRATATGNMELINFTPAGEAIGLIVRRLLGEAIPIGYARRRNVWRQCMGKIKAWLDGPTNMTY